MNKSSAMCKFLCLIVVFSMVVPQIPLALADGSSSNDGSPASRDVRNRAQGLGEWISLKDMPTNRFALGAAQVNGKIYAIGGSLGAGETTKNEMYDPSTNLWTDKSPMSATHYAFGIVAIGDLIYVIGGGEPSTENNIYNATTDQWTTAAPLPNARGSFCMATVGGKIYAIGGHYPPGYTTVNWTEEYNPKTNTWTTKKALPTARTHVACTVFDDKIYVMGGWDSSQSLFNITEIYDPSTDSWTNGPDLPLPTVYAGAAQLDNYIYLIGGYDGTHPRDHTYLLEPVSGKWMNLTPMTTGRCYFGIATVADGIYVIGGNSAASITNTTEKFVPGKMDYSLSLKADKALYRPGDNVTLNANIRVLVWKWEQRSSGATARGEHSAVWDAKDNRMLVFGGIGTSGDLKDLWSYDPALDRWTQRADAPATRRTQSAVWDASNERMLVFGGQDGSLAYRNDLWAYYPSNDTWVTIGTGATSRASHTAVWDTKDNQMLVFGGWNGVSAINTLWAYSPSSNTWAQKKSAPSGRWAHTAVWNPQNEQMLIFGGTAGSGQLSDLWSYDPATDSWKQKSNGPVGRQDHSAVFDHTYDRMLIYGGYNATTSTYFIDTWAYVPSDDKWSQLENAPVGKNGHVAVWDDSNTQMLMFSGGKATYNNDLWAYRTSSALSNGMIINDSITTNWTRFDDNPIIKKGASGSWNENYALDPDVLFMNGTYKMWFGGSKPGDTFVNTGYATSSDGLNWTEYSGNPVLSQAGNAHVVYMQGTYYMAYSYWKTPGSNTQIGWATSNDGITWTKSASNPIIVPGGNGGWDDWSVGASNLVWTGSQFYLYYSAEAVQASMQAKLGVATSYDGVTWTKYGSNPILSKSPGSWDNKHIYRGTSVIALPGGGYGMWYGGSGDFTTELEQIGYAKSNDGINWTRVGSTPVLPAQVGTWDYNLYSPSVVFDGLCLRMYYTGRIVGPTDPSQIGVAFSPLATRTPPLGLTWEKEPGQRLTSNPTIVEYKYPEVIALNNGSYRMFFTAGHSPPPEPIQSAISKDGTNWQEENGVRISVSPGAYHPKVIKLVNGSYRMYYSVQGPNRILSAISTDAFNWSVEPGVRLAPQGPYTGFSAPVISKLVNGSIRLYANDVGYPGYRIVSAISPDGLNFAVEAGIRLYNLGTGTLEKSDISPSYVQTLPDGSLRLFYGSANDGLLGPIKGRTFSAISKDGLHFVREGTRLEPGSSGDKDKDGTYLGCILKFPDGVTRAYYTAVDTAGVSDHIKSAIAVVLNYTVAFEVDDPDGLPFFIKTAKTDEGGLATVGFTLPIDSSEGVYDATAVANVSGRILQSKTDFSVVWPWKPVMKLVHGAFDIFFEPGYKVSADAHTWYVYEAINTTKVAQGSNLTATVTYPNGTYLLAVSNLTNSTGWCTLAFVLPNISVTGWYNITISGFNGLIMNASFLARPHPAPPVKPGRYGIKNISLPASVAKGGQITIRIIIENSLLIDRGGLLVIQILDSRSVPFRPTITNVNAVHGKALYLNITFSIPAKAQTGTYYVQVQLLTGLPRNGGFALDYRNLLFEVT